MKHSRKHPRIDYKPPFNYVGMPHLPRSGFQIGQQCHYATKGLFLETATPEYVETAPWTLAEEAQFAHNRWYPSAWMIYIYASDEYDALRKLCGSVKQWEKVSSMYMNGSSSTFEELMLRHWRTEQTQMQRLALKTTLTEGALSGKAGYTSAAKMLLQMIDAPARGRPKKDRSKKKDDDAAVSADVSRVVAFRA